MLDGNLRLVQFCNEDSYMQSRHVLECWTEIFASSRLRECVRMTARMTDCDDRTVKQMLRDLIYMTMKKKENL